MYSVIQNILVLILCSGLVVAAPQNDTVSQQNVDAKDSAKSENGNAVKKAEASEFYPQWVPFDNKNIDELGEFVRSKPKPKKRLAPPTNFIMKSPAEMEDEAREATVDKRDELSTPKPAEVKDNEPIDASVELVKVKEDKEMNKVNETTPESHKAEEKSNDKSQEQAEKHDSIEVSRIEEAIGRVESQHDNDHDHRGEDDLKDSKEGREIEEEANNYSQEKADIEEKLNIKNSEEDKQKSREEKHVKRDNHSKEENSEEEEEDDEKESEPKKELSAEEIMKRQIEDRLKKEERARLLASVDKLKEYHQQEQEKLREQIHAGLKSAKDDADELGKPVHFRNSIRRYPLEYGHRINNLKRDHKRWHDRQSNAKLQQQQNSEEQSAEEEEDSSEEDNTDDRGHSDAEDEHEEFHKKSVANFAKYQALNNKTHRNYRPHHKRKPTRKHDDDEEDEASNKFPVWTIPTKKSSASSEDSDENVRINLAPQKRKIGRKYKKKKKVDDSTVSETSVDPTTTVDAAKTVDAATTLDAVKVVADAAVAASNHGGNSEHEKGGGKEHHSHHHGEHGEKGHKAYKGHHTDTKNAEGHHDKEGHKGKYEDHGGHEKKHHDESGHHGENHKAEKGKKHAEYEESGKHSKGHSTKGSHDIHKKEEYEKKVEFFEEDGDSGEEEKHGGYHEHHGFGKGGKTSGSNLKGGHHHADHGKEGHFDKGEHHHHTKGHKHTEGHSDHHQHKHEQGDKHGKGHGKKWVYHHGHPAKTAHLVAVDKRSDRLINGFIPYY